MLMLSINETIGQLALSSSVCLYGHVLRKENGYVKIRSRE